MKLHQIVIAVIVVSMVTTGLITYLSDLGTNYDQTADFSALNKTQNAMDDHMEYYEETSKILNETLSADNFFIVPYQLVRVTWSSVRNLKSGVDTTATIVGETTAYASTNLNIPQWVSGAIIAIITVSLVAMLIYAAFKWKFED